MSLRVLVCGDRKWGRDDLIDMTPQDKVNAYLDRMMLISLLDGLWNEFTIGHLTVELSTFTVIEGHAEGADKLAHWWAADSPMHNHNEDPDEPFFEHLCFPADWNQFGKAAGPIRNRKQHNEGKPDVVVACHHNLEQSKGTLDMCNVAYKAGTPVFVLERYSPKTKQEKLDLK